MKKVLIGALLGALLACPVVATAQGQSAQAGPTDIPQFNTEVVVTPERAETPLNLVSASTIVLEAQALRSLPGVQLAEMCSFLPGFQLAQAQPYSVQPLVSARGFFGGGEAEYVLLLVDGVPMGDAESGLIDWSVVPTSSIRRIEAFRGPGASLYGDSAIGGVIQVLTDRAQSGGNLTASGGSFGTLTGDGSYGGRFSSVGFVVTGGALRTNGASAHAEGRHLLANGSLDGTLRGAIWRLTVNGNDRHRDDPGVRSAVSLERDPYGSDALFRFDQLDRTNVGTAFALGRSAGPWQHQARVHSRARRDDLVRTILLAPELGDRRARALSTSSIGGTLESGRSFGLTKGDTTLLLGLDLSREHLDTSYGSFSDSGVAGAQSGEVSGARTRTGIFVSSAWKAAPRLRLTGAARWDRVADDFGAAGAGSRRHDAWSPRVGGTLLLDEQGSMSLFAQASRAFKAPTIDQLFDPRPYPDFMGGTFSISNAQLVPQRATNLEAGVSGGSRLRWRALAYRMAVDDEIDFDIRTFSYANIGRSQHTGVELEANGTFLKRVHPSATYALTRVTLPGRIEQLKNVPRHVFTVSGGIDLPLGLATHIRYRQTSGAFLDDEHAYPIDGPETLDLRLRRFFGRQVIFVDVLNLTDSRYQEYGFTLSDFEGQVTPYAYPGAPRAMRVGVIASF
jgi:outer membrane cobalamin receptor